MILGGKYTVPFVGDPSHLLLDNSSQGVGSAAIPIAAQPEK